jgi:hypothetical protein
MANLKIVRIPLLERVVLEELANRWQMTTNEAVTKLIRQAAQREVMSTADSCDMAQGEKEAQGEPIG